MSWAGAELAQDIGVAKLVPLVRHTDLEPVRGKPWLLSGNAFGRTNAPRVSPQLVVGVPVP